MGQAADELNPGRRNKVGDDVWGPDPPPFRPRSDVQVSSSYPAAEELEPVSVIVASTTVEDWSQSEVAGDNIEGTEEIRVEIEQTRAEMSGTIDAIQERLSPRNLVGEAKDAVREATIGKAEQMVSNVGDAVSSTAEDVVSAVSGTAQGASSGIMGTIRANPIPAALAGLGLGWLFMNRQSGSTPASRYEYGAPYGGPRYPTTTYPSSSGGGVGQTVGQAKAKVGELADQAAETAGDVASSAGHVAGSVSHAATGAGASFMDVIRQNPVPAAVTGLGIAWLWKSSKSSSGQPAMSAYTSGTSKRSAYGAGYGAGEKVGEVIGGATSKVGDVVSGTGEKVGQVGSQATHQAERARGQLDRMLQEQPLAVGAVALGVGAAVGLMAPSTTPESKLMGDARDRLLERAQESAQAASEKVQRVAGEATNAAKEAAKEEKLTTPS